MVSTWLLVGTPRFLPSSPSPGGIMMASAPQEQPNEFRSRSTARIEEESFAEGTDDRRDRLHAALEVIGVDIAELAGSANLAGSSALRLYSSFVNPKSAGGHQHAQRTKPSESRM